MPLEDDKRTLKKDLVLAFSLIVAGFAITGISLAQIAMEDRAHTVQATPPLQGSPANDQDKKPAESKPGGERPTTPAPQPARPDPRTEGVAKPALPPAPAEKIAPPIQQK